MPVSSQFYIHHSGFHGPLTFNFTAQGSSLGGFCAIAQPPREPFCRIRAGKHGLYVELPVAEHSTAEEGDFVCLLFDHRAVQRRKRIDLFLTPSPQPRHLHARLTANETETLFKGDIPFFDDTTERPPFLLAASS